MSDPSAIWFFIGLILGFIIVNVTIFLNNK